MPHPTAVESRPDPVQFTCRGQAALNELATVLTARCSHSPEGVVEILDHVMHADLNDLAEAFSAIGAALDARRDTTASRGNTTGQQVSEVAGQGRRSTGPKPDKPQKSPRQRESVAHQGSTDTLAVPTVGRNENHPPRS